MSDDDVIRASLSIDGEPYRVSDYVLREALFDLGSFVAHVVHEDESKPPPTPKALVGKRASATLRRTGGVERHFAGRVIDAAVGSRDDAVPSIAVLIAPDLCRLALRADCRTFQNVSVPDIVKQVLVDGGVPQARQDWRTTGTYPARVYVVQYDETDLHFVQRLLSEEGIYFAIHHEGDEDHVVFGDDPTGFGPIEGKASLPFREVFGFHVLEDAVMRVEQKLEVVADRVTLRDYDPHRPKLRLEGAAQGTDPGPHALEVYDYPGRFDDAAHGERLARARLRATQAARDVITGETGAIAMRPGVRFSIEQHPYAPFNREYLVTAVDVHGESAPRFGPQGERQESGYGCRFTAIPTATSPYAPPAHAAARTVPGIEPAFTTGPAGEEIHTSEQAEVKLRFPWDRSGVSDDHSSRWARTLQLPTSGAILLPRVGWEVAVSRVDGDVDRPVVLARLYNGLTPPPYALPANKGRSALQTATTPGGGSSNELRLDDSAGGEEIWFNASKDMSVDVGNNLTESIGNDERRRIGANRTLEVTNSVSAHVGGRHESHVGGDQTTHVKTMMIDSVAGSHALSIGGGRRLNIGGDHKRDVDGDSELTVAPAMIDLVVGAVSEHTLDDHGHDVRGAFVEMTAGNRSVTVAGARHEHAGAVKIKVAGTDVNVQVTGAMMHRVAGVVAGKVSGDRVESAGATYTEIAGGAHIVKAKEVVYEAETALTLTMGASAVSLTPAAIVVLGASIKLDGDVSDGAALVMDN